jgi:hypothetical protein
MKIIGKSRLSGRKPNVRFDERELEIKLSATTPALYSTDLTTKENGTKKIFACICAGEKLDRLPVFNKKDGGT